MNKKDFLGLALAFFAALLPATAQAGMYSYTDERGEVHFVDSLEKIPDDKLIELEKEGKIPPKGAVTPTPAPTPVPTPIAGPADPQAAPPAAAASNEPKTCKLEIKWGEMDSKENTPLGRDNQSNHTVRYEGKVLNTGTGMAKVVGVKLILRSAIDGRILDQAAANTVPINIGPNQEGTFSVTGDYEKVGLHNKKTDKVTASYVRCD